MVATEPSPPAWSRVASTAFTASRGGFAPSTLALLNYNGLSDMATPISVAIKAAGGLREPSSATVRNVCGGDANKVLVSYNASSNGSAMMKDKMPATDYGPTKALPHTGPVLVMKDGVRILTHMDNPRVMTTTEGKKLALYYGPDHGRYDGPPAQAPTQAPPVDAAGADANSRPSSKPVPQPEPQPEPQPQQMPVLMMRIPYPMPHPANQNVAPTQAPESMPPGQTPMQAPESMPQPQQMPVMMMRMPYPMPHPANQNVAQTPTQAPQPMPQAMPQPTMPHPMPHPMPQPQQMPGMVMRMPYPMPHPANQNVAAPMRVMHHIHHHYEGSESNSPARSIFDERRPEPKYVATGAATPDKVSP